jgi:dipeptidyl aminopeptidase/acylaminoacyl peptidase
MTVEDVLAVKSVGDVAISPDGRWVAYVLTERDVEMNGTRSDIWLVSSEGGAPVRLTYGPRVNRSPRWALNGNWLAFLSDRNEDKKVQ